MKRIWLYIKLNWVAFKYKTLFLLAYRGYVSTSYLIATAIELQERYHLLKEEIASI